MNDPGDHRDYDHSSCAMSGCYSFSTALAEISLHHLWEGTGISDANDTSELYSRHAVHRCEPPALDSIDSLHSVEQYCVKNYSVERHLDCRINDQQDHIDLSVISWNCRGLKSSLRTINHALMCTSLLP